jgi:hypothetical protein
MVSASRLCFINLTRGTSSNDLIVNLIEGVSCASHDHANDNDEMDCVLLSIPIAVLALSSFISTSPPRLLGISSLIKDRARKKTSVGPTDTYFSSRVDKDPEFLEKYYTRSANLSLI